MGGHWFFTIAVLLSAVLGWAALISFYPTVEARNPYRLPTSIYKMEENQPHFMDAAAADHLDGNDVVNNAITHTPKRQGYISWDDYFMSVAVLSSKRSKDPSSPSGACIVDKRNRIVGM